MLSKLCIRCAQGLGQLQHLVVPAHYDQAMRLMRSSMRIGRCWRSTVVGVWCGVFTFKARCCQRAHGLSCLRIRYAQAAQVVCPLIAARLKHNNALQAARLAQQCAGSVAGAGVQCMCRQLQQCTQLCTAALCKQRAVPARRRASGRCCFCCLYGACAPSAFYQPCSAAAYRARCRAATTNLPAQLLLQLVAPLLALKLRISC
jgi:hypothetical protein